MLYVKNAILDSVLGAGYGRQDLSTLITKLTNFPRPISESAPTTRATNELHQWREVGLNAAGSGLASYKEGALPNTIAQAAIPAQNQTCRVGLTAQVTDEMTAVWTGAGEWELQDADMTRRIQSALDLQVALGTEDVLNEIEFMHATGDSTNPQGTGVFPGGQCDGLLKWVMTYGSVAATGGSSGAPAPFTKQMVIDLARQINNRYPGMQPDTLLVPSELRPDINTFVGGDASRPIVQMIEAGPNGTTSLVGGSDVAYFNTGYSTVKIKTQPYFSSAQNQWLTPGSLYAVLYNTAYVKNAALIPLGTTAIARTDTSLKKTMNTTFTQEHRAAAHAGLIPFVHSAIA